MSDTPIMPPEGSPSLEVMRSLVKIRTANKEEIASLNGEIGDRTANLGEANPDFDSKMIKQAMPILEMLDKNELKGRQLIEDRQRVTDYCRAYYARFGHAGDLVDMAGKPLPKPQPEPQPAPSDALPLDEALTKFEATADKAPTPAEVDEKTAKRAAQRAMPKDSVDALREDLKAGKSDERSFTEIQREENAKGDAHIRAVAGGREHDTQADLDRRNDARQEAVKAGMPDIPEPLDRRERTKSEPTPEAELGKFRVVS